MRKTMMILMAIALCFNLFACGDDDGGGGGSIEEQFAACDDYDPAEVTADTVCDYVVCAFAAGYNACVDAGGDCSYITDCAEVYIECVCPGGDMTTDTTAATECGTTYTDCILDNVPTE